MDQGNPLPAAKPVNPGARAWLARLTLPVENTGPAWWLLPVLLVVTAAAYSMHWDFTIDDAAISFTYARNFAEGLGLGALYPGAPRVEGYSNFLWVVVLGLGTRSTGFDTILLSKTLGLICALGAMVFLYLGLNKFIQHSWLLLGLALVPLSLTFSFWSVSGLENSFYAFLILASVYFLIREEEDPGRLPVLSAVGLLLVSMTRPEGLIYAAAAFAYKTIQIFIRRFGASKDLPLSEETAIHGHPPPSPAGQLSRQAQQARIRGLLVWAGVFVIGYALFKTWHWWYFASLWPNPIYAKAGWFSTDLRQIWFEPQGWVYLRGYFRTFAAAAMLPAILFGGLVSLRGRQRIYPIFALAALVLPLYTADWMVNARFVYPFIPFQAALVILGLDQLMAWMTDASLPQTRSVAPRWQFAAVLLAALLLTVWFAYGVARFAWANVRLTQQQLACGYEPMAEARCLQGRMYWTMDEVDQRYDDLRGYAAELGLKDPLYLIPDIGATSYLRNLRLLDLASLADVHLAHSRDGELIKQYLFKEQLPDLIKTHGIWTRRTDLTSFSIFKENYLPIEQGQDSKGLTHGTFVRKDLVLPLGGYPVESPLAELSTGLELTRLAIPEVIQPGRELSMELFLRAITTQENDLELLLRLSDASGKVISTEQTPLGYGFFPTSEWPINQIVRQFVKIPTVSSTDMLKGNYTLEISLVDENGNSVENPKNIYLQAVAIDSDLAERRASDLAKMAEYETRVGNYSEAIRVVQRSRATGVTTSTLEKSLASVEEQILAGLLAETIAAKESYETALEIPTTVTALESLTEFARQAANLRGRTPPSQGWRDLSKALSTKANQAADNENWPDAYRLFLAATLADPNDAWAQRGLERSRRSFVLGQ